MRMDIKLKTENLKFKFRVSGVFIHDNKILVDKYTEKSYCLPGGYVSLGETSEEGMLRELKEEVGCSFKIDKFMGISESLFTNRRGENIHEIGLYYYKVKLVDDGDINLINLNRVEDDHGFIINHHFKWISINELENIKLLPDKINKELTNDNKEIFHYIIKDNK